MLNGFPFLQIPLRNWTPAMVLESPGRTAVIVVVVAEVGHDTDIKSGQDDPRFPLGVPVNRPAKTDRPVPNRPNWFFDVNGAPYYVEPPKPIQSQPGLFGSFSTRY